MDRASFAETFETLLRQTRAETLILEAEGRRLEAENQRLELEIRVLDANRAARKLLNEVLGLTAEDGHESQGFQAADYSTSMEAMQTWVTNTIEDFKQNFGLQDGITETFKQDLLALLEKNSKEGVDGMKEYELVHYLT